MIERLFVLNQGIILSFMHLTFSFNLSDTIKLDEALATSTDSTLTSFALLLLKILASSVFWAWVQVTCVFVQHL